MGRCKGRITKNKRKKKKTFECHVKEETILSSISCAKWVPHVYIFLFHKKSVYFYIILKYFLMNELQTG